MPARARPKAFDFREVREKSLDDIEGVTLEPPYATGMIAQIARARAQPIGTLTPLDLRLLLSQREAPIYLLPIALELLELDPLLDAGIYRGDLLRAALRNENAILVDDSLRTRTLGVVERALVRLSQIEPPDPSEIPDANESDFIDRQNLESSLQDAADRLRGDRSSLTRA